MRVKESVVGVVAFVVVLLMVVNAVLIWRYTEALSARRGGAPSEAFLGFDAVAELEGAAHDAGVGVEAISSESSGGSGRQYILLERECEFECDEHDLTRLVEAYRDRMTGVLGRRWMTVVERRTRVGGSAKGLRGFSLTYEADGFDGEFRMDADAMGAAHGRDTDVRVLARLWWLEVGR